MKQTTLCYIERPGQYLMLHRVAKEQDENRDKWIGVGGKFEEGESPEECLLREVREETGLTLTRWRYRGLVTFISDQWPSEQMHLFTADQYTGQTTACDEGELAWVEKSCIPSLPLWQGDKLFFRLLEQEIPFFSLKLVYQGEALISAALNGKPMPLEEQKTVVFRPIELEDAETFWNLLNALDTETNYMMYEPGERRQRASMQELKDDLRRNVIDGADFLQIAADGAQIIGYLRAERGRFNRIAHTAYLTVGILRAYGGRGIGAAFFQQAEAWAKKAGVTRLELTVECHNEAARRLYQKSGFQIEGVRQKSMLVDGRFIDEYYMAKLL